MIVRSTLPAPVASALDALAGEVLRTMAQRDLIRAMRLTGDTTSIPSEQARLNGYRDRVRTARRQARDFLHLCETPEQVRYALNGIQNAQVAA